MAVRLTVKQRSEAGGAEKGTEVMLDDEVITLGRDKSCQVVLSQMAVSRSHARITKDGSLFFVEDLGSAYGTTINGKPLPRGEKRLLRNGDLLAIAQFDITFDRIADAPQAAAEKTSFIARHVVKDVMRGLGSGEGPYFRIMNGPREGQRIELSDAQELVFGREDGVDVVLKDDLVSRRHAKVRRDWSGTHVEDLGSRNGIKVNKKRTTRKTLKDRDELEIGGVRLLYLDPSEVRETPLVLADDRGAEEEEHTNSTDEEPASEPSEENAAHASAAEEPEPQAAADENPAAEEPEPEPDESEPEPDLAAGDDSDEPEDPDFDPDEPPSDEAEEEEDDALPPGRSSPGARGGKGQKSALGNITLVVKDVRKIVPIAVFGVFCLLALGVLIAIFAGA